MENINPNNYPKQTLSVTYSAPRTVNIGDVFYVIKPTDFQTFREPCVVCNGTKELTVNGVTFKCPCCNNQKEVLCIGKYVVRRYRVYGVVEEMPTDDWTPSKTRKVRFLLYRKSGRGHSCNCEFSECTMTEYALRNHLNEPVENVSLSYLEEYFYDDYKLAVSVADALTVQEMKKLGEYNFVHGTNHVPAFKAEHDKKSK